jgi:hypothetical protein
LAEKSREERTKEISLQQEREQKNNRNKSTNMPQKGGSGQALMNRSGNAVRKDNPGLVKLPKVGPNGNNVGNSSMKGIL